MSNVAYHCISLAPLMLSVAHERWNIHTPWLCSALCWYCREFLVDSESTSQFSSHGSALSALTTPLVEHAYGGPYPYLKSRCDVPDDAIVVQLISCYIICHLVYTSTFKLKLSCAKTDSEQGFDILSLTIFQTEPKPKLECIRNISREP